MLVQSQELQDKAAQIRVFVPKAMLAELDAAAERQALERSPFIRRLLRLYLDGEIQEVRLPAASGQSS
jgi:metal-responsive CopG/Arc/MetJ family transcriptional regulator